MCLLQVKKNDSPIILIITVLLNAQNIVLLNLRLETKTHLLFQYHSIQLKVYNILQARFFNSFLLLKVAFCKSELKTFKIFCLLSNTLRISFFLSFIRTPFFYLGCCNNRNLYVVHNYFKKEEYQQNTFKYGLTTNKILLKFIRL